MSNVDLNEIESLVNDAHELATQLPHTPHQDELCSHLASAHWVIGKLLDGETEDAD